MPNTFTFTTDDPALASRIMQVIQGRAPTAEAPAEAPAAAAAAAAAAPAAPLETPSMAGPPHTNSGTPPTAQPSFASPPSGVGNAQTGLQQAIEATNAMLDKYLQAHKAAEAKVILQKYGLKRISDATDPTVLANLYREFSGQ